MFVMLASHTSHLPPKKINTNKNTHTPSVSLVRVEAQLRRLCRRGSAWCPACQHAVCVHSEGQRLQPGHVLSKRHFFPRRWQVLAVVSSSLQGNINILVKIKNTWNRRTWWDRFRCSRSVSSGHGSLKNTRRHPVDDCRWVTDVELTEEEMRCNSPLGEQVSIGLQTVVRAHVWSRCQRLMSYHHFTFGSLCLSSPPPRPSSHSFCVSLLRFFNYLFFVIIVIF